MNKTGKTIIWLAVGAVAITILVNALATPSASANTIERECSYNAPRFVLTAASNHIGNYRYGELVNGQYVTILDADDEIMASVKGTGEFIISILEGESGTFSETEDEYNEILSAHERADKERKLAAFRFFTVYFNEIDRYEDEMNACIRDQIKIFAKQPNPLTISSFSSTIEKWEKKREEYIRNGLQYMITTLVYSVPSGKKYSEEMQEFKESYEVAVWIKFGDVDALRAEAEEEEEDETEAPAQPVVTPDGSRCTTNSDGSRVCVPGGRTGTRATVNDPSPTPAPTPEPGSETQLSDTHEVAPGITSQDEEI